MNNKITYTDENLEFGEIVEDFLPHPNELILKQKKVKIFMELTEENILFLQREATKKNISDQGLIELIINEYINNHIQNFS